ncbi:LOW QUALITY PROTEIN: PGG domain-containing protein, partial [Cephalotus follicularis]
LAPPKRLSSVSCPALQMQRELQWFKEVEKWIKPELINKRDEDKKTAWELFTKEHEDLVRKGESWMKDTSNSCMVVATLISTVVFAAAFTVPGGNSSEGVPIFLGKNAFEVFIISDALALLSSLTSLLMFLSILTAKYAEEDFLKSLPLSLATLFFAIAAVMTSFVATLIILNDRVRRVTIPITALASIPVTLFVTLQLPLFIDMCRSTCGAGIFRPQKLWYRHSGRSVLE